MCSHNHGAPTNVALRVETRGIEPLTSTLQTEPPPTKLLITYFVVVLTVTG